MNTTPSNKEAQQPTLLQGAMETANRDLEKAQDQRMTAARVLAQTIQADHPEWHVTIRQTQGTRIEAGIFDKRAVERNTR